MSRCVSPRLAGFVFVSIAVGVVCGASQEARLTPTQPQTSDIFGYGMAFDGTTVVGGAPFATISGVSQPGRAVVFHQVSGVWTQEKVLRPSIIQANAFFGVGAAVEGDTLVVGAPGEDLDVGDEGAVYVFSKAAGVWTESQRLTASDAGQFDNFGSALALQGDMLLVGSPFDSNDGGQGAGAVYVFVRQSGVWGEVQKLTASTPGAGDDFGFSVALDADMAVVGARDHQAGDFAKAGAAYIFKRIGGVWQEVASVEASDPAADASFGYAVTANAGTVAVGAYKHPVNGAANAGAVYLFNELGGAWRESARLVGPAPQDGDHFGTDVSLRNGTLLIGAYLDDNVRGSGAGGAHVYRKAGASWNYDTLLVANDSGAILTGWKVALAGDRAALAAPFYQTNRGAVYVFAGLSPACNPCDTDCDGSVNQFDIQRFVDAVAHSGTTCSACAGDVNADGSVNQFDIQGFVGCLAG